ncbi:MAG: tRNA (mo5U34)-methyltransferase [Actinomycetota bacterium]|nr:tRNA (mo5U34)-methyltransferase [Actinomycetota bacterium]
MPERSLRYRGFGLTVAVPDRLARLLRRPHANGAAPTDRLVVQPPPPVHIDSRERERAFMAAFAAEPSAESETAAGDADELSGHPWYHTIRFPDGSATPGRFDHQQLLPHYALPEDLHGKRALDVGSGDGFWAFELERRGADVTSLDIETFADVDLPPALHDIFVERPRGLHFRRGFRIAHRRLGSRVKLINQPVYDLDPDEVGTFDFVHAGDILLHVRDPILALQRLRTVTAGELLLADCFDPTLDERGAGPGLTHYRGGWEDATWWTPALTTLTQMVADAGFEDVHVVTTYNLGERDSARGWWRAVLRART